ncbi:MAG: biotin/lipoyl-binding protein [Anaerolineales bacterium]|nr:biotin/lipoyl-binding protein [Anaerolineales bacterium]
MSRLSVTVDGYTYEVELDLLANGKTRIIVYVDGEALTVDAPDLLSPMQEMEWFIVNERPYEVMVDPDLEWVRSSWGIHSLEIEDQETTLPRPPISDGRIKAPIPGQITQVLAAQGDEVELGQPLLVLEAMKMENEIRAPRSGRIKELCVAPGQRVTLGQVLIEIE